MKVNSKSILKLTCILLLLMFVLYGCRKPSVTLANQYQERGKYKKAINVYKKLIDDENYDKTIILKSIADCYYEIGDRKTATEYYMEIQNLNKPKRGIYEDYLEAMGAYSKANYLQASEIFETVISNDIFFDRGKAYYQYILTLVKTKKRDKALEEIQKAQYLLKEILSPELKAKFYFQAGLIYYDRELYQKAIENFKIAIEFDEYYEYYLNIGRGLLKIGKKQAAFPNFFKAYILGDYSQSIRNEMLEALDVLNMEKYINIYSISEVAYKKFLNAVNYFHAQEFERSRLEIELAVKDSYKVEKIFRIWHTELYESLKKETSVQVNIDKYEKLADLCHYVLGYGPEAKEHYEKILKIENRKTVIENLGIIYFKEGDYGKGREFLLNTGTDRARFYILWIDYRTGGPARELLKRISELSNGQFLVYYFLRDIIEDIKNQGDLKGSVKEFLHKEIVSRTKDNYLKNYIQDIMSRK